MRYYLLLPLILLLNSLNVKGNHLDEEMHKADLKMRSAIELMMKDSTSFKHVLMDTNYVHKYKIEPIKKDLVSGNLHSFLVYFFNNFKESYYIDLYHHGTNYHHPGNELLMMMTYYIKSRTCKGALELRCLFNYGKWKIQDLGFNYYEEPKDEAIECEPNIYCFKDYHNSTDTSSGIKINLDGFTVYFNDGREHDIFNHFYFYAYNKEKLIDFSLMIHWDCGDSAQCFKFAKEYDKLPDHNKKFAPTWTDNRTYVKWWNSNDYPIVTVFFKKGDGKMEKMNKHYFIYCKGSLYHIVISKDNYKAGDMKLIDEIFDSMEFF